MNFIRKFARDLQLSKRRQSAPVLVDEPHKYKSEEYMQALSAFNDWRKKRLDSPKNSPLNNMGIIAEENVGSTSSGEKSSPTYADIEEGDGNNTPPEGFFRSNSIPDLAPSPRKSSAIGERKTSKRNHKKGKAPPPPPPRFDANAPLPKIKKSNGSGKNCLNPIESENAEDTDGTRFSGSYKKFDIDSSSTCDDYVISKNIKNRQKKVMKNYPVTTKNPEDDQMICNGMPPNVPKKYPRKQNTVAIVEKREELIKHEYDEVIDEGFRFLNDKYGYFIDTTVEGSQMGGNGHIPVTDLDKSDETESSEDQISKETSNVFGGSVKTEKPLNWTVQSLDSSVFDPFYTRFKDICQSKNVIVCWPNEIQNRKIHPRSTMITPLEFSTGIFRNSMVSVRKYSLEEGKHCEYAEKASRRDFEILNYLRHPDVAVLMAVNLDRVVNQMNLVMEPFDFTLNYFMYKYNREFPVSDTISIIQQLASAVQYLHECEYIHSNISSHAIMMRMHPVCVKLTCFELATSAKSDIKKQLEKCYGRQGYYSRCDGFKIMGKVRVPPKMPDTVDKEKYIKMSRQIMNPKITPTVRATKIENIDSKYMPYFQNYRQRFSLHYYQAPELVKARALFVVPRKECDVYSLTILLWEMLNRCIPYVMYSYEELEAIHATGRSQIPIIDEERCQFFDEVFSLGLEPMHEKRFLPLTHFASLLEETRLMVQEKEARLKIEIENKKTSENPNINSERSDKVPVKDFKEACIVNSGNDLGIFNDVSLESVDNSLYQNKPQVIAKANSCQDEFLGNFKRTPSQRTNGELSDALSIASLGKSESTRKKRSVLYSQLYEEKPEDPFFNLSQSTIFNSNADFHNKLLETAKQGDRLERTSTTKKKKSRVIERAMDIFGGAPAKSRVNLNERMENVAYGDSAKESSGNEEDMKNSSRSSGFVERAKAKLEKCFLNGSRNCSSEEDLIAATEKSEKKKATLEISIQEKFPENVEEKVEKVFSASKYSFNVGRCDLPKAPIARKNKLRRYAWLSERKPSVSPNGSSFNFLSDDAEKTKAKDIVPMPQNFKFCEGVDKLGDKKAFRADIEIDERRGSSCNISLDNSFRERKVNVNLKVKHNNQEIFNNSFATDDDMANISQKINQIHLDMFKDPKTVGQDSGLKPKIDIKMVGHRGEKAYEIQREILDLSAQIVDHFNPGQLDETLEKSSFERDSRKLMIVRPEVLQNAIRRQRKATQEDLDRFENSLWRKEKSLCEKTSYNGSLAEESDAEDLENCPAVANKRASTSLPAEGLKNDTEDLYIDDDLSLWPTLSVNIDLDFIKGSHM